MDARTRTRVRVDLIPGSSGELTARCRRNLGKLVSALAAAGLLALASADSAQAAISLTNPGFETATMTGWLGTGSVDSSYYSYLAPDGQYFAYVLGGSLRDPGNVPPSPAECSNTLSQSFHADAGDTLSGWSFFAADDYVPYNDRGTVRLLSDGGSVVSVLFSSDISTVGNYAWGPWVPWSYTFTQPGTYTLEVRSTNVRDCGHPSAVGLDLPANLAKTPQTISFTAPSGKAYGDPDFDPGATASSGLPVTYSSSTPGVCTIVDGKVHIVGAGECTVTASQAGNDTYAGEVVTRTFTIATNAPSAKADQTISFTAPPGKAYGDSDFDPGATASSGLPVTYSSSTPTVCTIVSGKVHIVGAGTCTVTASQAGDANFNPQSLSRTFTIAKGTLAVNANDQSKQYGTPNPALTYTLSGFKNGEDRGSANVTGEASCSIDTAAGPAAGTYAGAISCAPGTLSAPNYGFQSGAKGTLTINKADQGPIDFPAPAAKTYGDSDFDPGATASSGLPVTYSSSTPSVCTIVAGKVHIVGAGECTVVASQAGNANFNPQSLSRTFTIAKASQTISFTAPSGKTYGDPDFDPGATASSGLPVPYSSSTPTVCTIVSGKVHIVGAGECTVVASQAGNADYNPQSLSRTFTVAKATLAVNVDNVSAPFGSTPSLSYTLSGFKNGENRSSANVTGEASCSLDPAAGPAAGTYRDAISCTPGTLSAPNYGFQAGSGGNLTIEAPAPAAKADQTISFAAPAGKAYGDLDFDPGATASSGLPLTYSSSTPIVCTIVAGKVHIVSAGDCTVTASQPGDGNFNSARDVTRTFIAVGSLPGDDAFVIGDEDADLGTKVTYWGAQWWKVNDLSGGPAPRAFKGFADSTEADSPGCGDAWTTRPGDSSKPPRKVPAYMAVIVASKVRQFGSTIRGSTLEVVVVKTNSGYDSNPGHAGTGTVVAELCD